MLTRTDLLEQLDAWGIAYELAEHAPVMTMTESASLAPALDGERCKSLLLRDKRGALLLVLTTSDTALIDLVALRAALGTSRLSFASREAMEERLGVTPGSLSPLALINDADRSIRLVVDRVVDAEARLLLHPLENTSSISIARDDLHAFLARINVVPQLADTHV